MLPTGSTAPPNECVGDPTTSHSQANGPFSQLTFKPASGSVSDLLDLNELFADEFYPPDLDFSRFLQENDLSSQPPIHSTIFPSSSQYMPSSYLTSSNQPLPRTIYSGSNDIILIPPTIPTTHSLHQHHLESSEVSEEDKGDKAIGIKREAPSDSRRSFPNKSQKMSELKELSDSQRVERRERNREHAKRSRIRKKLLLDSLQDQLHALRQENINLRRVVVEKIPTRAAQILSECTTVESSLLSGMTDDNEQKPSRSVEQFKPSPLTSNIAQNLISTVSSQTIAQKSAPRQQARILMEPDYRLIQSLVTSQQNFVLSDPSLPDNPIVYASDGFCKMTGYKRQDVLGRNCRFLQGPLTDQQAVEIIRQGIAEGRDISVCLLNYKADGKPFWNQFFLAALKDSEGRIVNYVGVQCEVNNIPVFEIKDRVKKLPIPSDL